MLTRGEWSLVHKAMRDQFDSDLDERAWDEIERLSRMEGDYILDSSEATRLYELVKP